MAKAILIKRGTQGEAIKNAVLKANELALAWNAEKSTVELYAGTGEDEGKGKVLINPDVTSEIAQVLTDAKAYTDTKITDLIDGAPETADTLKELADAIKENKDVADAITEAIGKKLDKPATDGTEGQVLKRGADGKPTWEDETDTTYGEATQSAAGLMSSTDKTKLDGINGTTGDTQTVSQAEKDKWNEEVIDGGSY